MKPFKLDLHIHTVLSPCADLMMTPGNIIDKALARGIDIIGITDHNSAANVEVALKLARDTPLKIIPGMEVETREEVHLLCFFADLHDLLKWEQIVYEALPDKKNREEYFGYQLLTDINDDYIDKEERLLAAALKLSVNEVVKRVKSIGGYVVPSHVNRANSIISNLGFIPPGLSVPVLEITTEKKPVKLCKKFPFLQSYNFIRDSDSHYLHEIKPGMKMWLADKSLDTIMKTARGEIGRKLLL